MSNLYHPFDTDHFYQLLEDGNIEISAGDKKGVFTNQGIYVSGDIKQADPQLCVWVANNPDPNTQLTKPRVAGREV